MPKDLHLVRPLHHAKYLERRPLGVKNAVWAVLPFWVVLPFCAEKGRFEQKMVTDQKGKKKKKTDFGWSRKVSGSICPIVSPFWLANLPISVGDIPQNHPELNVFYFLLVDVHQIPSNKIIKYIYTYIHIIISIITYIIIYTYNIYMYIHIVDEIPQNMLKYVKIQTCQTAKQFFLNG